MALQLVADSISDLPEALRETAKPDGTRYVAQIPQGWAVEDVGGLRKALSDERANRKAAEARVKTFDGIDDAEAARDALERLRSGALKGSKEVDEFKLALQAKVKADLDKLAAEKAALETQLAETLIDRDAATAIARHKGKPALLTPVLRQRIRLETNGDGRRHAVVLGEDSKPMVSRKAGSTAPMGVDEFVEMLRDDADFRSAFDASGAGGSGAAHTAGGSARGGHDLANLSPEAKLAHYHAGRSG